MIISYAYLVLAPATLVACLLALATAVLVLRKSPKAARVHHIARRLVIAIGITSVCVALLSRLNFPDWVHDFWAAQIPMVALFWCSGILLCTTWSDDAALLASTRAADDAVPTRRPAPLWSSAWIFAGLLIALGAGTLALHIVFPPETMNPRATGRPAHNLVELFAWSFGGPLPVYLQPFKAEHVARGMAHLPREVTVPMGTTLIAAWLWIGFCALALIGRLVPLRRFRIPFYLLAPIAIGAWGMAIGGSFDLRGIPFDTRYFSIEHDCGIWKSDPATMKSYGPVLLVACVSTLVLALALLIRRHITGPTTAGIRSTG
jgi:hypothetical protein